MIFLPESNIAYTSDIVCDIVYDIVYDVVCEVVCDVVYDVAVVHISFPFCLQDTLCLVAPYPFRLEPLEEFDPLVDFDMTGGDDAWFARSQLFFSRLFEVNIWMWRYGRWFPRKMSVKDAEEKRRERV